MRIKQQVAVKVTVENKLAQKENERQAKVIRKYCHLRPPPSHRNPFRKQQCYLLLQSLPSYLEDKESNLSSFNRMH